jgi:hypothetical protein
VLAQFLTLLMSASAVYLTSSAYCILVSPPPPSHTGVVPPCCSNSLLCFQMQGCPHETFTQYWHLRQQGVPIGPIPPLDAACTSTLHPLLGPLSTQYQAAQLAVHPELLAIGVMQEAAGSSSRSGSQHYGYHPTEPPDPSPVVAWAVGTAHATTGGRADAGSRVAQVIRVSYEALAWVKGHAVRFPVLALNSIISNSTYRGGSIT